MTEPTPIDLGGDFLVRTIVPHKYNKIKIWTKIPQPEDEVDSYSIC